MEVMSYVQKASCYYRTPHYQSPETIARQHYTDTWVEQILSYPIDGIDVKSLA